MVRSMMRKTMVLAALFCVLSSTPAWSVDVEFNPYYGYIFFGSMRVREGDLNIKDSDVWGINANIAIDPQGQIEIQFLRQDTELELKEYPTSIRTKLFDMAVQYYQLAGIYRFPQGNYEPYVIGSLGATSYHPRSTQYGDEWLFSGTVGGGIKVFFSRNIGARFQGRLLLPFQFSSGGIFCGTGGCGIGVGGGTAIAQVDASAGLTVRF